MSKKKSWKDHLLSSGLPLEQSVEETLRSLGFGYPHEYGYERINEMGIPTTFSVDLVATRAYEDANLWLDILVECKYRHDSARWVFASAERPFPHEAGNYGPFIVLDELVTSHPLNGDPLNEMLDTHVVCTKGVELLPDGPNPKSIDQAIKQLRFGTVERVLEDTTWKITSPPLFAILPIIVTTAELWCLPPHTTLDRVRDAQEPEDIADHMEVVIVYQPPDRELTQFTRTRFGSLPDAVVALMREHMDQSSRLASYSTFIELVAEFYPSFFLVIAYGSLYTVMPKVLERVQSALSVGGQPHA